MGTKNKITKDGFVSENVSGTSGTLEFSVENTTPARPRAVFANDGNQVSGSNVSVTKPVTIFNPGTNAMTASLPAIGSSNVSAQYWIVKSGSNSNNVMLSASNQIDVGGTWTYNLSGSNDAALLMASAISGSGNVGYFWHLLYKKVQ